LPAEGVSSSSLVKKVIEKIADVLSDRIFVTEILFITGSKEGHKQGRKNYGRQDLNEYDTKILVLFLEPDILDFPLKVPHKCVEFLFKGRIYDDTRINGLMLPSYFSFNIRLDKRFYFVIHFLAFFVSL
jgi:hypothetical protein